MADDPVGREQLLRAAWLEGNLGYMLREHGQTQIYNAIEDIRRARGRSADPIVLNTHRRFGKTFLVLLRLVERAYRRPGQFLKYGGPTEKQCFQMAVPNLNLILRDAPEGTFERRGFEFSFHNPAWAGDQTPSVLWLVGCNENNGDSLRGQAADAVALDECRDLRALEYVVRHVLGFQFFGRPDPELLLISTPPKSSAHDFSRVFVPEAKRDRRYIEMPSSSNADWSAEDEQVVLSLCGGGKESIAWRREAQCELVTDEEEMIVPEFLAVEDEIVVESYERPPYFRPHVVLDTGWLDWNAVVFGYVDFLKQTLIVEDEVVARYRSTGEIAGLIRAKEETLYRDYRPIRRLGDLKEQALHDLRVDERVFVQAVEKWDRDAAIAALRTTFQQRKIRIHRRCENLIFQLRNGVWNKNRTDFERNKALGHCDALAALVYFHRMATWDQNPYPPEYLIPTPSVFHAAPKQRPNPWERHTALRALKGA